MRSLHVALVVLMAVPCGALAAPAGSDDPKTIIAAQIREQGYQCDQPQSAVRDTQASRPDEAVWVLECEGDRYRVRLDPDMAAKVERLDGKEDTDR